MSDILTALLLGALEGLTEFIPVSSTGHLVLLGEYLQFTGDRATTFEVFIQLGAILAVVVVYWPRFFALIPRSSNAGLTGWRGLFLLALATFPALILGGIFHHQVKELFSSRPVALALILGGIALVGIERTKRTSSIFSVERIGPKQALGIGLFQCLALWPGVSRSGATILGGMLLGLERTVAAEFSFLAAVPIMVAATAYDILKNYKFLTPDDLMIFVIGFVVSFVTALLAIKIFIRLLAKITLAPFGYYRIALGLLVLFLLR